jgi:hypothetical protein
LFKNGLAGGNAQRLTTGQARLSTLFLPFPAIGIVRRLLSIADAFLYLALDLLRRTFDLLFAAPRDLAHLALYFAGDIFDGAFDLITIHDLPRCVIEVTTGTPRSAVCCVPALRAISSGPILL